MGGTVLYLSPEQGDSVMRNVDGDYGELFC